MGRTARVHLDCGGHVQFSHYGYYDAVLDRALGDRWLHHRRRAGVWLDGELIPYPLQHNLHRLPPAARERALAGLEQAAHTSPRKVPADFHEWVLGTFGEGLAALFFEPYNEKVWGYPLRELGWSWSAERVALCPPLARCAGSSPPAWTTPTGVRTGPSLPERVGPARSGRRAALLRSTSRYSRSAVRARTEPPHARLPVSGWLGAAVSTLRSTASRDNHGPPEHPRLPAAPPQLGPRRRRRPARPAAGGARRRRLALLPRGHEPVLPGDRLLELLPAPRTGGGRLLVADGRGL